MDALLAALRERDMTNTSSAVTQKNVRLVIGEVGKSDEVARLLKANKLAVGDSPESLLIRKLASVNGETTVVIAGRDPRGLSYAVWEVADAIGATPVGGDVLSAIIDASESPKLNVRSVSTHLFNADLERDWYFSEAYWHHYFSLLARSRFNTFILTFADQTNYLAPPFPWLFDVEGHSISVDGLSKGEQQKNLAMLRRIGELAREHGLDFTVAIWQQQPVLGVGIPEGPFAHNYGKSAIKNLPKDAELTDYNTKALARLLAEVPTISGLQLRLNYESGIPEKLQHAYYQSLFTTIKNAGRPIRVELRYKSLAPETIEQAVGAGLDVTVSTKFWCEHLGLPFHPTTQDALFSASRYGYGTMLKRDRNYRVSYQLWNQGSNRLLLWGDPDYAARFAQSVAEGEGDGFEVFAPLTNKGWGNEPGAWRIFATKSQEHFEWEAQRYWAFYGAFGRYGYNPATSKAVWKREFVSRFGAAGSDVERAMHAASGVLPFITAVSMTSPSEWGYWPEVETGGSLDAYSVTPPSDYGQFYAARKFQVVTGWTAGQWSVDRNGFVEDAMADDVEAKWTPFQSSAELDRLAAEAVNSIDAAKAKLAGHESAEFRATEVDVRALAALARYHAAKKRAATHLAFFRATGEAGRLVKVHQYATESASQWELLAKLTDGFYSNNLLFGRSSWMTGPPDKRVNAHTGHWSDRVFDARADVKFAADLLAKNGASTAPYKTYPGETPLEDPPRIEHVAVDSAHAGTDLVITARVTSKHPLRKVLLRHRPMDQTQKWTSVKMTDAGDGTFRGTIAGSAISGQFSLLYYLEARVEGGGTLWPDWRERAPYVVVKVTR